MKLLLLTSLAFASLPPLAAVAQTTSTTTTRKTVLHLPAHTAHKVVVTHAKTVTRDAKGHVLARSETREVTEVKHLHGVAHHAPVVMVAVRHHPPHLVKTALVKVAAARPLHPLHPAHRVAKLVPPPAPAVPVPPAPVAAATPPPVDPNKGTATGLALPRFAALRSDAVSFRSGPGTRYPIDWIYQRRDLPVKIEREFEVWRLVSEPDGTKGWVHQAMLTGRRGFLISSDQPQTMRDGPAETAQPVAILKPGVVGQLLSCTTSTSWCQVQVKTYKGYLPRSAFWGTLDDEVVAQ